MIEFVLLLILVEYRGFTARDDCFLSINNDDFVISIFSAAFNSRSAVAEARRPRIIPSASNTKVFSAKDNNPLPDGFSFISHHRSLFDRRQLLSSHEHRYSHCRRRPCGYWKPHHCRVVTRHEDCCTLWSMAAYSAKVWLGPFLRLLERRIATSAKQRNRSRETGLSVG